MGAVVVLLLVVVALLIGGVLALRAVSRDDTAREERVTAGPDFLRFQVPEGRDAAALVAALRTAGYEVAADHTAPGEYLLIGCPGGTEQHRAAVRAILVAAPDLQGVAPGPTTVRFADE